MCMRHTGNQYAGGGKLHIESLDEVDTVEVLIDDEVEPDSLEWHIAEPPQARQDEEDPWTVVTLTLKPWEGDSDAN